MRYYVDVLGFRNAPWGNDDFTSVNRERRAGIDLCRGAEGQPGTWVWIGVEDVQALYEEYKQPAPKFATRRSTFPGPTK